MDLFWQFATWQEKQARGETGPPCVEGLPALDVPKLGPSQADPESRAVALFMRILPIVDRITRAVALYCGGVLLFVMMIVIIVDVVGRYFFSLPLYGSLDISITLLVLIVASAIAYGGRTGAHITADIFSSLLGPWVEWLTAIFVKFFAAAVTALWCWRLIVSGRLAARLGESTLLLNISFEPVYYSLAAGVGIYALALLAEGVVVAVKGEVPLLIDESRIVMNVIPATENLR